MSSEKIRQIEVAARMPKIDRMIKKHGGKSAILDQATRCVQPM